MAHIQLSTVPLMLARPGVTSAFIADNLYDFGVLEGIFNGHARMGLPAALDIVDTKGALESLYEWRNQPRSR